MTREPRTVAASRNERGDHRTLAVMTHDEIAVRLCELGFTPRVLSRARIQQLERSALAKLRKLLG